MTQAESGEAALSLLRDNAFDLAIVDLDLGTRIDGLRVRSHPLAVAADGGAYPDGARITGVCRSTDREGVDGYLLKPAEPEELLAAAEALARRRNRPAQRPAEAPLHLLRHGALVLDLDKHQATRAGQPVDLAPAEFSLLAHLMNCAWHSGAERAGSCGPGV